MKKLLIALILVTLISLFISTSAFSKEFITLTTATSGGGFYAAGIALAQLWNEKLGEDLNLDFSAISSSGSVENADLLMKKEAEIAFMQNNIVLWAYQGIKKYEGYKFDKLRTLIPVWEASYFFLVEKDINSLSDIKGRRFCVGRAGSGTETSTKAMLNALGITYDDFEQEYLGHAEAGNALRNGLIDGFYMGAGYNNPVITELMIAPIRGYKFLSLTDEQVATINKVEPWLLPHTVPANSFPNQPEALTSLKHQSFLLTTDDLPEELAYLITKTAWENKEFLVTAYSSFEQMRLDIIDEFNKYPVPIHPGAIKYYKEVGVIK